MTHKKENFVFGPVPSRRLGRSLGVDIVPFKTCSLDCVYCQLGTTQSATIERESFVPVEQVLEELRERLEQDSEIDVITFSGSGEPTLNSDIGKLITSIKELTDIPVVVLTNGTLLWDEQVRRDLMKADVVVPSFDAGDAAMFERINRPHPDLDFDRIAQGLVEFRKSYNGKMLLEVFVLDGVNSSDSEILKIKKHIEAIRPDKVQLNTVARPPAEDSAKRVPEKRMNEIKFLLGDIAEVIASYESLGETQEGKVKEADVLALLQRRPCTLQDIADGLGVHVNEVLKYLARLEERKIVEEIRQDQSKYYQMVKKGASE